ncbi:Retrovirus-related Pol polyprotein from transposon 17.6, partial [Mucuna pruriens]
MDSTQLNYTTTRKQLLSIVFALDIFRSYLLGSKIIIFFDHAALWFLLKKPDVKPRLIRWMLLLQEFDVEIRDRKGVGNSIFPPEASKLYKEKLKMVLNTTYGMIRTFGDSTAIKSFAGAFWISSCSYSSTFFIQHPEATTMDQLRQLEKCLTVGFTGLPFSKTPINSSPPVNNVKE